MGTTCNLLVNLSLSVVCKTEFMLFNIKFEKVLEIAIAKIIIIIMSSHIAPSIELTRDSVQKVSHLSLARK